MFANLGIYPVDLKVGPGGDLFFVDIGFGADPPHHLHGRRQPRADRARRRHRPPTGRRRSRSGSTPRAPPTRTATRSPTSGTSTATASTTTPPRQYPRVHLPGGRARGHPAGSPTRTAPTTATRSRSTPARRPRASSIDSPDGRAEVARRPDDRLLRLGDRRAGRHAAGLRAVVEADPEPLRDGGRLPLAPGAGLRRRVERLVRRRPTTATPRT